MPGNLAGRHADGFVLDQQAERFEARRLGECRKRKCGCLRFHMSGIIDIFVSTQVFAGLAAAIDQT
jgi:hypothetical protein